MKRQIRVQPNFVLFFIGTVIPERLKNTDYEHQRQKPSLEMKSLFNMIFTLQFTIGHKALSSLYIRGGQVFLAHWDQNWCMRASVSNILCVLI